MSERCDISELFEDGHCPVCSRPVRELRLDAWDERRAATDTPEPEPLVLHIPA